MKPDDIIEQKLFETCKLSEFYLSLLVNSKCEDESPFQLAKAYTLKLYEIVRRYDDKMAKVRAENREHLKLNLLDVHMPAQLGASSTSIGPGASIYGSKLTLNERLIANQQQQATAKRSASVLSSTGTYTLSSPSARTSTPNKCFMTPSPHQHQQLLQQQLQLSSQSTPVTPCESKTASSINLTSIGVSHVTSSTSMKQSSSNYLLSSQQQQPHHQRGRLGSSNISASCLKLNTTPTTIYTNSTLHSFYKNNPQRYRAIYCDEPTSTLSKKKKHKIDMKNRSSSRHSARSDGEDDFDDENDVDEENDDENMSDDETVITSVECRNGASNLIMKNDQMLISDISYTGYNEYQKDNEIELDDENTNRHDDDDDDDDEVDNYGEDEECNSSHIIEKSYSNLSKDSGVLIDSYHSDYSVSSGALNRTSEDLLHSGKTTFSQQQKQLISLMKNQVKTTPHSKPLEEEEEAEEKEKREKKEKKHRVLAEKVEEEHDGDNDDDDVDDDNDVDSASSDTEKEEEHASNDEYDGVYENSLSSIDRNQITDSTHILLMKKKNKHNIIGSKTTSSSSLSSTSTPYRSSTSEHGNTMYEKNPAKYSSQRPSKLAYLHAKKQSYENNHNLNLDLDMSMLSMIIDNDGNAVKTKDDGDVSTLLMTPSPSSSSSSSAASASDEANSPNHSVQHRQAKSTAAVAITNTSSNISSATPSGSSPFTFNSLMNVSMLDNIQATNTNIDMDSMNTSILMFN